MGISKVTFGGNMMISLRYVRLLLLFITLCADAYAVEFNVRDFGVTGLKKDNARRGIQEAIDACAKAGGGTVLIPAGDYTTGTLVLRSDITLHLEAGATIWGSRDEKDYQTDFRIYKNNRSGDPEEGLTKALIYAKGSHHISITGQGTIHGQAQREFSALRAVDGFIATETENARKAGVPMERWYKVEPFTTMIFLEECEDVTVRDVQLIESSAWTLHFKWCNRISVSGIYLFSSLESGVNADGIDIDGCSNVTISDCIIETGDDAIVLKTTTTFDKSRPCENIVVTNCILTSTSTALKLGTESHADFRYVSFSNCVIRNSNRGLSIVIRDGATAEHITFSNIQIECKRKPFFWWGNGDPIWLVVKQRFPDSKIGAIRDVHFQHIYARGQGTARFQGLGENMLERISLHDVVLVLEPEDTKDKRSTDILQFDLCKDVILQDVELNWDVEKGHESMWRHALAINRVNRLMLSHVTCNTLLAVKHLPSILLRDVSDVGIDANASGPYSMTSFRIEGVNTARVRISCSGLCRGCERVVSVSPECTDAVHFLK
jgi:hypothetical protein